MKMHILPSLLVSLCTLPALLVAQNVNDGGGSALPEGPLLKRAPMPSKWTITYKTQPGGSEGAILRGGVVVKTQSATFERLASASGSTLEAWRIGNKLIRGVNGTNWVDAYDATPSINRTDYATSDFAGFDWITLSNFVGEKTVEGRKCLVFKDHVVTAEPAEVAMMKSFSQRKNDDWRAAKTLAGQTGQKFDVAAPDQFDDAAYKGEVTAYIDEETRLPVALVYPVGKQVVARYYQFESGPETLTIPEDVQQLLGTGARSAVRR